MPCVALTKSKGYHPDADSVDVSNGWDRGVAFLKDFDGVGRMLAIPTHRVSGIEDSALLTAEEPNYFALAWGARGTVERRLRQQLPRETVAITVNSMASRSQDQLHLRIDCIDKDVAVVLASYSGAFDAQWRPMTVDLKGQRYWARRLESDDLSNASPFRLLADGMDGAKTQMGLWSLAAVGANFSDKPGFVLLANRVEPTGGGRADDLQDRDCAIAYGLNRGNLATDV